MARSLKPLEGPIYGGFRIVFGVLFVCHGLQKTLGLLDGTRMEPFSLLWVAGLIELVGGACVAAGLFTRWAAFLCSGQMAVAYFRAHQPQDLLPIQNGGELAALYAWAFLFIAAHGPGTWSLDRILNRS